MPIASSAKFPDGFVWGAATAAYQIEGAVGEDDRGVSIWDTFSHAPGRVHHDDTGDVACDHYHRVDEDLGLISSLGLNAYRFSIAWPRIQPTGKGPANQAGLDFYRRLVDGLRQRGIRPAATLYHWDLPQALEDAGGWRQRDTSERFAEYAAIVGDALGDDVAMWITLNEPWCSAWLGYALGAHAPGLRSLDAAVGATHHLLLGHGQAMDALRSVSASPVGITLNPAVVRPASDHPADVAASERADGYLNRLFLDPLFRGAYPADMIEHYPALSPGFHVKDGDLDIIGRPVDFLGVNFYRPCVVADRGRVGEARTAGFLVEPATRPDIVADDLGFVDIGRPGVARTTMDWEIEADALNELLQRIHTEYTQVPIYITENGAAFDDYVDQQGEVRDPERIEYIDGHLRAVHDAIAAGVDVRGYFVWSLMDNFEWGFGYAKRFGIIWVDYPTGARIPKRSYAWYRDVIAANGLPPLR